MKRKMIFLLIAFLICIACTGRKCLAAAQRVMLKSYKQSVEKIYPGDSFKLKFVLENTSKYEVRNIKVTVSADDGSFLPDGNAGTIFVEKIGGEQHEELEIALKAGINLTDSTYKIAVKTEYEGSYSTPYEVTDYVYIPVSLKQDIMISDLYVAEEDIRLGDNIEILGTVNNTGAATLYNVKAAVSGSNISEQQSYIGNIAPGKNASIDVITKTTALYKNIRNDNKVVVSYEDREGNRFEKEMKITSGPEEGTILVQEVNYADLITIKEDTRDPDRYRYIGYIAATVAAVAVIAVIIIVRKRRKQRILDEF